MWWQNLNAAQRTTAEEIMNRVDGSRNAKRSGWKVYIIPTVGPARYLELRHYFIEGNGVARWVIEPDGTVSATNDEGQSRELIPVEAVA